jgi:hypothetical protein
MKDIYLCIISSRIFVSDDLSRSPLIFTYRKERLLSTRLRRMQGDRRRPQGLFVGLGKIIQDQII